jgi:hypothetical protein
MKELKNVMTFEQFSSQETEPVNEGLFTSLKTDIDRFLKSPTDEVKADKLLSSAFAQTFNAKATASLKTEVLGLPLEDKISILTQCSKKLEDPKVGVLKLIKTANGFQVGGNPVVGGMGTKIG